MTDESQQYIGPLPQTGAAAIHLSAYGTDRLRRCVAQVLLDIRLCRKIAFPGVFPLFSPAVVMGRGA